MEGAAGWSTARPTPMPPDSSTHTNEHRPADRTRQRWRRNRTRKPGQAARTAQAGWMPKRTVQGYTPSHNIRAMQEADAGRRSGAR